MYLYMNGKLVGKEDALISPFDHGFLYGMGLFETFRTYGGHPFLLDDHLDRLNNGLKVLNIDVRYTREEIVKAIRLLLKENKLEDAYFRLNVSAGIGEIGLQTEAYENPNLIIFAKPLPPQNPFQEKKAVILKLKRNTPEGYERLKSHHYLNNILAKREIGNSPDCEGIFLTKEEFLAEGVVSNLFWIKESTLFTPAIETGILNGITRQFIISLARKNGMHIHEGFFSLDEAIQAEEMFVSNSIQEMVPISSFDGKQMPGAKGEKVRKLQRLYQQHTVNLWSRDLL
ncbi:aminodeoxychorismate lyase [Bacillus sp. S/N-304-OC-R1]|uniref:aminodeoxychorismate lyase n=1 Tax=Bacillus sp. S/N-304-OC-R1 TaxID=2758034 RepID=UPI001C8EBBA2|nr:aminodeoxychorismate lyase [Bacillus sp. S/N-304-OC-R1]MBY0124437.1 aminodeoxychorismate lyase [Bacillus sp. S/N-304-OC-R1]